MLKMEHFRGFYGNTDDIGKANDPLQVVGPAKQVFPFNPTEQSFKRCEQSKVMKRIEQTENCKIHKLKKTQHSCLLASTPEPCNSSIHLHVPIVPSLRSQTRS